MVAQLTRFPLRGWGAIGGAAVRPVCGACRRIVRDARRTRCAEAGFAHRSPKPHPGEEIIYVLEGALEYQIEGKPPMTFNAGDALTVPAGAIHAVRNVGSGNAAELATYVVEKGKPLLTPAE